MSWKDAPQRRTPQNGLKKVIKTQLRMDLHLMVILLPLEGHKIFVASLVDPFLVDCIILHQHPSTDCTSKFHDIYSIQGCLWWFYTYRFQCEKYSGGCGGYDQSIFDRVFNVFLLIKTTHLLYRAFSSSDLKHITSFWFNGFFMLSCLLAVCKKYANAYGKDSKYTNAIDISIL